MTKLHFDIQKLEEHDMDAFITLTYKLWQNTPSEDHENMIKAAIGSDSHLILIAKDAQGNLQGFSMVSIRTDYVEGAKTSPTGYLEGIYVNPDYRGSGISRHFLEASEVWLKKNNCSQLGSDTWLSDHSSRSFHKHMGFWEEDELVHFLKDLN